MRYWPVASVTTDRTCSISAGLAASTITPGSSAPDVSFVVPVIVAWAHTTAGTMSNAQHIAVVTHACRSLFAQ